MKRPSSDKGDAISTEHYDLHFLFPEDKCPKAVSGELWLTSSNREDESFSIPVSFA